MMNNELDKVIKTLRGTYENIAPIYSKDIVFSMCDKAAAELVRYQRIESALRDIMKWIDNWEPDFVDDPEWGETASKVKDALNESESA